MAQMVMENQKNKRVAPPPVQILQIHVVEKMQPTKVQDFDKLVTAMSSGSASSHLLGDGTSYGQRIVE
jgi:hypothetical protein